MFLPILPGIGITPVLRGICATTLVMLKGVAAMSTTKLCTFLKGYVVPGLLAGWGSMPGPRATESIIMGHLSAGRNYYLAFDARLGLREVGHGQAGGSF